MSLRVFFSEEPHCSCAKDTAMDRHEREARIAIILVALPFPPMPVVACRGEDAVDSVCSSHDLHAVMIATDMQRALQGAVTAEQQEGRKNAKCIVLNEMHDRIRTVLARADGGDGPDACEQCYDVLRDALRKYWALYSHECSDVRICGMDSILPCDLVYKHMLAYVQANLGTESCGADTQSYKTLLRLWLRTSFTRM